MDTLTAENNYTVVFDKNILSLETDDRPAFQIAGLDSMPDEHTINLIALALDHAWRTGQTAAYDQFNKLLDSMTVEPVKQ